MGIRVTISCRYCIALEVMLLVSSLFGSALKYTLLDPLFLSSTEYIIKNHEKLTCKLTIWFVCDRPFSTEEPALLFLHAYRSNECYRTALHVGTDGASTRDVIDVAILTCAWLWDTSLCARTSTNDSTEANREDNIRLRYFGLYSVNWKARSRNVCLYCQLCKKR